MKASRTSLAILFVLAAAFGFGASDPGKRALELYKSIQAQNWKKLYDLAQFAPAIQKQLTDPDKFAKDFQKGIDSSGGAATVNMLFRGMKNIMVGKASVSGNKASEKGSVSEVEDIAGGKSKKLTANLKAGHYVLICNLPGHYKGGMRSDFTVK